MNFTIYRDGENRGPYSLEQIKEGIANGTLHEGYLAWYDGCTDWVPLKVIISSFSTLPSSSKEAPSRKLLAAEATLSNVINRYSDAYIIARAIIGTGTGFKILAVITGIGIALLGLVLATRGGAGVAATIVELVVGFGVGAILFVLGILIQATGQIHLALLDNAVHTSPFLSKEQMASAMNV